MIQIHNVPNFLFIFPIPLSSLRSKWTDLYHLKGGGLTGGGPLKDRSILVISNLSSGVLPIEAFGVEASATPVAPAA